MRWLYLAVKENKAGSWLKNDGGVAHAGPGKAFLRRK
jgi:hypothetical protein